MNRTNQILAGVLALQLIVVAIVLWPRPAASLVRGEPLFPDVEADQIVRLTITSTSGDRIQLAKNMDKWVLPEADDYPTQEKKVPEFLEKIVGLTTDRLVAKTRASHKRLKVAEDDFERRIVFELADGTTHTLYLGTAPRYGTCHVRADKQDEVYLTRNLTLSDASTSASLWINTVYFSVPKDQVVAMTVENQNGRFEFEKDEAGKWAMKDLAPDEKFKENNVISMVNRLVSLRMRYPLGKTEKDDYGLKEPNAMVTVKTKDSEGHVKPYSLLVGAKNEEENSYVVKSSESPYYVYVSDYLIKAFVERGRKDFTELPPTPTPEATPETSSTG